MTTIKNLGTGKTFQLYTSTRTPKDGCIYCHKSIEPGDVIGMDSKDGTTKGFKGYYHTRCIV